VIRYSVNHELTRIHTKLRWLSRKPSELHRFRFNASTIYDSLIFRVTSRQVFTQYMSERLERTSHTGESKKAKTTNGN
jgi:hypothetical protein